MHEDRRILMLNTAEVDWIEAADYYAQMHVHGHARLLREPLQELAERLGDAFLRVVLVVLQSGARVPVSRSRRASVLRDLGVR